MRSAVRRAVAVALLAMATAWLTGTAPASAHAVLLSSNPVDGATLQSAPSELRLVFDEDVTVDSTAFHLVDGDGRSIPLPAATALDEPGADDAQVVGVRLPRLDDARYLVRWESITSDDFHPVSGSFTFGVGVDVQAAGPRTERPLGSPLESALRAEVLVGFVVLVGSLVLLLRLKPLLSGDRRSRRVLGRTAALGEIATILGLVSLLGLLMDDSGSPPPSSFLAYWGLAIIGVVAAGLCCRRALAPRSDAGSSALDDAAPWLGVAALVVAADGLGHLGHASATSGSLLSTAHVVATAVWTGGVTVLTVVVLAGRRRDPDLARTATRRFGAVAVPAVLLSTFTGLLLARPLVPAQDGLTDTGYGHGLLVKLGLVVVAVALGGLAFVRARRGSGRHQGVRLGAEIVVMGGILLAAASMSAGQPPDDSRWLPTPSVEPTAGLLSRDVDDLVVTMSLSPGVPGPNFATIGVLDTRRPSPATVTAVVVSLGGAATPVAAVQQIERSAPVFPGAAPNTTWVASSPVTTSGAYDITVTVRRDGEPDSVATFAWQVAPSSGTEAGGHSLSGVWSALAAGVAAVAALTLAGVLWRRRRPEVYDDHEEHESIAHEALV